MHGSIFTATNKIDLSSTSFSQLVEGIDNPCLILEEVYDDRKILISRSQTIKSEYQTATNDSGSGSSFINLDQKPISNQSLKDPIISENIYGTILSENNSRQGSKSPEHLSERLELKSRKNSETGSRKSVSIKALSLQETTEFQTNPNAPTDFQFSGNENDEHDLVPQNNENETDAVAEEKGKKEAPKQAAKNKVS